MRELDKRSKWSAKFATLCVVRTLKTVAEHRAAHTPLVCRRLDARANALTIETTQ